MSLPSERERACGPCTQCCKVMNVVELNKPPGVRCVHLSPKGGCGIHGSHPGTCRQFSCDWLRDARLPHRLRPDQSKVVLHTTPDMTKLIAHCDPSNPLAWKREPIYSMLRDNARRSWGSGFTVLAMAGLRTWVVGPEQDFDLGDLDPFRPVTIQHRPDGSPRVIVGERVAG